MSADDIGRILQNAETITDVRPKASVQNIDMRRPPAAPSGARQSRSDLNAPPRRSRFVQASWTEDQIAEFEERAAIIENDGKTPRDLAEFLAAGTVEDDKS